MWNECIRTLLKGCDAKGEREGLGVGGKWEQKGQGIKGVGNENQNSNPKFSACLIVSYVYNYFKG